MGKTGTTNDAKDSWFAGYSGDYLSVVWVGRDDNKPAGLTGATGALPVWLSLMKQISIQPVNLIPPDNITIVNVDATTGQLANANCGSARSYPYISGSQPKTTASCGSVGTGGGGGGFYVPPDLGKDIYTPDLVNDELPTNF